MLKEGEKMKRFLSLLVWVDRPSWWQPTRWSHGPSWLQSRRALLQRPPGQARDCHWRPIGSRRVRLRGHERAQRGPRSRRPRPREPARRSRTRQGRAIRLQTGRLFFDILQVIMVYNAIWFLMNAKKRKKKSIQYNTIQFQNKSENFSPSFAIGWCKVTNLVPSGKVPSTWTSSSSSATPVITSKRCMQVVSVMRKKLNITLCDTLADTK